MMTITLGRATAEPLEPGIPPMTKNVLVGVLSAGEPSLEKALDGIRAQDSVSVEIIRIADRPKREAHQLLYSTFSERTADVDLLVKVDADMELVHPRVFAAIGEVLDHDTSIDLVSLAVDDWLSGRQIWGLNAWRGGVRWSGKPPELFTDQATNTAREATPLLKAGFPLVLHAVEPSAAQSLRYGSHRALKAASHGTPRHLNALERLVDFCRDNPAMERRLVQVAVELSLRDPTLGRALVDNYPPAEAIDEATARAAAIDPEELAELARRRIDMLRAELGIAVVEPRNVARLDVRSRAARAGRSLAARSRAAIRPAGGLLRRRPLTLDEVLLRGLHGPP